MNNSQLCKCILGAFNLIRVCELAFLVHGQLQGEMPQLGPDDFVVTSPEVSGREIYPRHSLPAP